MVSLYVPLLKRHSHEQNLETVKVMLREQYMKNLRVLPMLQTKMAEWEKEKQEFENRVFSTGCL